MKQYWGFDAFRSLQAEIIQSVMEGRDTLALMPTGGGKSLCFQVPALCMDGMCLVISPLIALMKDQVENLQKRGIAAEAIFSGMAYRDIDRILDNCAYGGVKLLYCSPERLKTELMQERLKRMKVNLLAVDEAHCVSQWGYDFRPPYLEIAEIRDLMPKTPILALTATATPDVVQDIQEKLLFNKNGQVFQKSFARQNLSYVVFREEGKEAKMLDILKKTGGSAVVYARNRRRTRELAQWLVKNRISADFYHAGLSPDERSAKQEAWTQNRRRVMVSTNAFGMGIDKPDVRVVVHMDLPDSLEAYFQEAGRAGRDGQKSYAVLLYNDNDRISLEKSFEIAYPELEEIRRTYRALGSYLQLAVGAGEGEAFDFDLAEFAGTYNLEPLKTLSALKSLEQAGWIILTEAVYIPSSLLIKVDKDELYDYQLKHPKMDRILKSILRSYQGAFNIPIKLKESQLAKFLKMPVPELQQALTMLHQEGIVEYRPAKDQPQLIFIKERVDAANLAIDREMYHFRRERHRERLKKALAYAETPVCRSKQLLEYFGEKTTGKCGICDVCLGRTSEGVSKEEFDRFRIKIERLLKRDALTLDELVQSFSSVHEDKVLEVIGYLIDEGFVDKVKEKLVLTDGGG
ncbi:MAG TPA: ATP-dependent DNA helicase RecQ [Flavilitoribacter sp.]|nr:ATP-dependent DNA helicase RecQ [Flavilitoribacter sp.]